MGREKVHMVLFGNLLNNPLDVLYGSLAQSAERLPIKQDIRGEPPLYSGSSKVRTGDL